MTNNTPQTHAIVLFAHGSRDPLWHRPMEAVATLIQRAPEHYHWAYKRFKALKGLENIYQVDEAEVRTRVAKIAS